MLAGERRAMTGERLRRQVATGDHGHNYGDLSDDDDESPV